MSLLSAAETQSPPDPPKPEPSFADAVSLASVEDWRTERPLWTWLAVAAALLLAGEALVVAYRRR